MFPTGFWDSPLWKEAARAGLRQISKMVSDGNISGASRLATTPGVLKPSAAGSQIKHLGQGAEGLATMVAHPEHGVAVRKLYDPRGVTQSEMIARKEQAGRALGDSPHFAKFLGSSQTPQGGQMHFNEYIQGGQAPTGQAGAQSVRHTQVQANRALNQAGFYGGKDIHAGNMIFDKNTGTHKAIDYIPTQQGEFLKRPKRFGENITLTPKGEANNILNTSDASANSSAPGMLNRLLGGGGMPGGIRAGDGPRTMVGKAPARPLMSSPKSPPQVDPPKPTLPAPKPVEPPQANDQLTRVGKMPKTTEQSTQIGKMPKPVQPISPVQT